MAGIRGDDTANYNPGAAAASGVVKAAPGTLYTIVATNTNAAARYLQFYNLTAVPADTTVPFLSVYLAIGASKEVDLGVYGIACSVGICWANSSTGATKTIGAADTIINVTYA